jgi:hypothetical protein
VIDVERKIFEGAAHPFFILHLGSTHPAWHRLGAGSPREELSMAYASGETPMLSDRVQQRANLTTGTVKGARLVCPEFLGHDQLVAGMLLKAVVSPALPETRNINIISIGIC